MYRFLRYTYYTLIILTPFIGLIYLIIGLLSPEAQTHAAGW